MHMIKLLLALLCLSLPAAAGAQAPPGTTGTGPVQVGGSLSLRSPAQGWGDGFEATVALPISHS